MAVSDTQADELEVEDPAPAELGPASLTVVSAHDDEPPFDPPDADDDIFIGVDRIVADEPLTEAANAQEAEPVETESEDAPSDPPEADDRIFASGSLKRSDPPLVEAPAAAEVDRRSPVSVERIEEARATEKPVPAIKIYASWDREQIGEMLARLAGDPRMARADIEVERGGLTSAIARFSTRSSPDLLIVDTHLSGDEMLAGLDRLSHVIEQGAKVIVVGGVNDIGLLRDLAQRGVNDYMVAPMRRDDLARAICGLYAEADISRVIAVIGACGGVGASTIAHNLAWSIAERQESGATLVDLDLSFGTAAFSFKQDASQSVVDVLSAPEDADDSVIDHAVAKPTRRLRILPAPANVGREFHVETAALDAMIGRARRTSPYVILDLPHQWNGWVKHALARADDILIVAGPDLAGLRNAKNFLERLRTVRPEGHEPVVALSMVGVPKRPEILLKDFTEALGVAPQASFAFDPALYGMAAIDGKMIGDVSPESKTAQAIDALAATLTGRRPIEVRRAPNRPSEFATRKPTEGARELRPPQVASSESVTPPQEALTLDRVVSAPPPGSPQRDVIEKARDATLAEIAPARASRRGAGARYALVAALVLCALRVETDRSAADTSIPSAELMSLAVAEPEPDYAANYSAAMQQLRAGRAADAVALLREAAEGGHVMAQYRLAQLYERGDGVEANVAQARAWTERAAAGGNRLAMHNLGVFYAQGEGAPVDEAAAFRWFRQAAEFGVADSQYNLGVLYQRGRGVNEDKAEALFWFTLAARQGDTQATARITEIETLLPPADIAQARARADAFRPRAANIEANGEPAAVRIVAAG